jgi:hypothetical protein
MRQFERCVLAAGPITPSILFDGSLVWLFIQRCCEARDSTALKTALRDPELVTMMQATNMWNRDDFAHTLYGS